MDDVTQERVAGIALLRAKPTDEQRELARQFYADSGDCFLAWVSEGDLATADMQSARPQSPALPSEGLVELIERVRPMFPITTHDTPDYAEVHFGDGHRSQAMTMEPAHWEALNHLFEALTQSHAVADGGPSMTDEQIKHMAERFLGWKLPENFNPDGGIRFTPLANAGMGQYEYRYRRQPTGTNLFDFTQAVEMVRHMVEGLPAMNRREPE